MPIMVSCDYSRTFSAQVNITHCIPAFSSHGVSGQSGCKFTAFLGFVKGYLLSALASRALDFKGMHISPLSYRVMGYNRCYLDVNLPGLA